MRGTLLFALATVMLLLASAAPAFALPPGSGGAGRHYAEHIRMEAQAGALGKDVHPGMHRGFAGFMP